MFRFHSGSRLPPDSFNQVLKVSGTSSVPRHRAGSLFAFASPKNTSRRRGSKSRRAPSARRRADPYFIHSATVPRHFSERLDGAGTCGGRFCQTALFAKPVGGVGAGGCFVCWPKPTQRYFLFALAAKCSALAAQTSEILIGTKRAALGRREVGGRRMSAGPIATGRRTAGLLLLELGEGGGAR